MPVVEVKSPQYHEQNRDVINHIVAPWTMIPASIDLNWQRYCEECTNSQGKWKMRIFYSSYVKEIQNELSQIVDIERIITRIQSRATHPKDIENLKISTNLKSMKQYLNQCLLILDTCMQLLFLRSIKNSLSLPFIGLMISYLLIEFLR